HHPQTFAPSYRTHFTIAPDAHTRFLSTPPPTSPKKRMACHNAILFFTVVLLWLIYASAQRSAGLFDSRSSEFYPGSAGSVAFLHHPLRVERKIAQRAFQNMDLSVARSFGKRDCYGKECVKREPHFFMDCTELQRLEGGLRRTDIPSKKLRRGSDGALLSDE
ncbi:unnamed protein product, partial [Callosobruchus maculatus]